MGKNEVEIVSGIPGVGKTKEIDQLLRTNPDKKKIYLALAHKQLIEREDFLPGVDITHWEGMRRICPLRNEEPIKTFLDVDMPIRWICRICQSRKLISIKECPHKIQFKEVRNTVIAPVAYLFTQHPEKYKPKLVVVDDITLRKQDLHTHKQMERYVYELSKLGFCDYETLEELFKEQGTRLKKYILRTIEARLKAGIKRLLDEGEDISKVAAKILLQIDPIELLDWYRLVKVYGWQEEFSIPLMMPVFELVLEKGRRVIVMGAQVNKPILEMLVRCFQKEYGYPITLNYRKMELNHPLAKSVIYRVRSEKYPHAWYPTTTSIVKSIGMRKHLKQHIETILLSQEKELKTLSIGIIKPKNVKVEDFLTTLIQSYVNIESLDFGSLRGSNKLEWCDILFIIGTYNINITDLQKDFVRFYHRKPWSVQAVKQFDGGYEYVGDSDLENYRRMCEEYEMYQAIHRVRPALRERKIYVFGLIPREISDEFQVKDVTFEKNDLGVMCLSEWKDFDKFVREKIGEEGIYQSDLVKAISEEVGIARENARQRVIKFVANHSDEYEITEKTIGDMMLKFVRKRR